VENIWCRWNIRVNDTSVSQQLYNSSTHFLLELLQNADDNQYGGVAPDFSITYKPGHLRIDCNEVGFTDRNVEAICAIGGSTKSGSDDFIGEKGIGFKSVFRVADAVWISSREYNFKLDIREDGELGMITPRWDAFPGPIRPGYTSLHLRLSEDCNETDLMEGIISLSPTLLIFLRRLRHIHLRLTFKDGSQKSEHLSRDEGKHAGLSTIIVKQKKATAEYMTRRHDVLNMPLETKRPHICHSELILAFDISNSGRAPLQTIHKVYAFLPIREHGFKVIPPLPYSKYANKL